MWQIVVNDEICGDINIVQGIHIWWMDMLSFVDRPYTTRHENGKSDYLWVLVTRMLTTWKTPCGKIIEF
jgi:hypothetical protein